MAEYAFKMKAQSWARDPYYVASSAPVRELTIVASTENEAREEAKRILPGLADDRYWKFWVVSTKDIRLLTDAEKAEM